MTDQKKRADVIPEVKTSVLNWLTRTAKKTEMHESQGIIKAVMGIIGTLEKGKTAVFIDYGMTLEQTKTMQIELVRILMERNELHLLSKLKVVIK